MKVALLSKKDNRSHESFNYTGTPILVDDSLMVFQTDTKNRYKFLLIQFQSSFIKQQLQSLQYDQKQYQPLEFQFKKLQISSHFGGTKNLVKEYKIPLKKEEAKVEELNKT